MIQPCVTDIRAQFAQKFGNSEFVIDKSGCKLLELAGVCFLADSDHIFGEPDHSYIQRELDWYASMSLSVFDIEEPVPKIWKSIASRSGNIHSNYGFLVWSNENGNQYHNVLTTLGTDPLSRRACMIYTRPSMHSEYCIDGMSDFICTNVVQYVIRDNCVHAIVQMRSNDAWAGYRNDYAWQVYVLKQLVFDLNTMGNTYLVGDIVWQVGSLHLYERQFYLVDHFIKSGHESISLQEYKSTYESIKS